MTYEEDDDRGGHGCLLAFVTGLFCWAVIIATCIGLFGCGLTTKQIDAMTGVELRSAHWRELDFWHKADMDIVRALRARGGITDADVLYYEEGGRWRHPTKFSCWGFFKDNDIIGFFYDWEALGYPTYQEWVKATSGLGSLAGGTTIFTGRGGIITVRSVGAGSFSVRSYGR